MAELGRLFIPAAEDKDKLDTGKTIQQQRWGKVMTFEM